MTNVSSLVSNDPLHPFWHLFCFLVSCRAGPFGSSYSYCHEAVCSLLVTPPFFVLTVTCLASPVTPIRWNCLMLITEWCMVQLSLFSLWFGWLDRYKGLWVNCLSHTLKRHIIKRCCGKSCIQLLILFEEYQLLSSSRIFRVQQAGLNRPQQSFVEISLICSCVD